MKKFYFLSFVFIAFISQSVISQDNLYGADDQPNTLVRLHFFSLGLSVEHKIGEQATILGDVSYNWENTSENSTSDFIFVPYFKVEPRYYFNLPRRLEKGKRTDYFSGQFVTFQTKVGIPVAYTPNWYSFGPQWGFQRTLGRKGYWSFQIGPVIQGHGSDIRSNFAGDFAIGFILN